MKVKSWLTLIERRCFFKLVEVSDHMEGVFNLLVYSSLVLCMFFFSSLFWGGRGSLRRSEGLGRSPPFSYYF